MMIHTPRYRVDHIISIRNAQKHEQRQYWQITPINQTDWARVAAMSDEDIAYDEDNPITTEADWEGAAMKIGDKVIGVVRGRGKQKKPTKIPTTLRLSPEVMAYFKATGEGWQTRVDAALREYIQAHPVR